MVASLGAPFASLVNITSALLPKLPPDLQAYVDTSLGNLSAVLANSTSYLQSTTGIPPTALYSTVAGALILGAVRTAAARKALPPQTKTAATDAAAPKPSKKKKRKASKKTKAEGAASTDGMQRHGWSGAPLSPYPTSPNDGIPDVTEADYEYITSDDLHRPSVNTRASPFEYGITGSRTGGSYFRQPDPKELDIPEDDVLSLRHGNEVKKEFFPAFSIGDGQLVTDDVRDRVQLLYDLTEAERARIKLYYKGTQLKNNAQPICKTGVKNNSEILVVLPGEEAGVSSPAKGPAKRTKPTRPDRSPKESGPSASTGNLEVPQRGRSDKKTGSSSRAHSAASGVSGVSGVSGASGVSGVSGTSATPAASVISSIPSLPPLPGPAMEKLDAISSHFKSKLLPICEQFIAHPPSETKIREDDHHKLSETIMQQVLLKLDEVGGDDTIRTIRKSLVNLVQETLKHMDSTLRAAR